MPTLQPIVTESLIEIEAIFEWLRQERGEDPGAPTTILVGGWAVYSYNDYYGSQDIDLITNRRTKQSLTNFLKSERGYQQGRGVMDLKFIYKGAPPNQILIDFGTREDSNKFEGREERLDLHKLDGNTETRRIGRSDIPVPTPAFLILMKLKAAWDRGYRLSSGKSHDAPWEQTKLEKDYADVLAMLNAKGIDMDIGLLGSVLETLPFLESTIEEIANSPAGHERVGITREKAVADIERFKNLVF